MGGGFEDNLKIVLFIVIGIFTIRSAYLFFSMRKALESFERRIGTILSVSYHHLLSLTVTLLSPCRILSDEMEGNEQLEEMKIRQRHELQLQKQNHMLIRMAGTTQISKLIPLHTFNKSPIHLTIPFLNADRPLLFRYRRNSTRNANL